MFALVTRKYFTLRFIITVNSKVVSVGNMPDFKHLLFM